MSDIVDELMHVQFVQYAEYRNGWTSRTLAKKAADEIIRLNRELADARNAALEEAAAMIDNMPARAAYAHYDAMALAVREMKGKAE